MSQLSFQAAMARLVVDADFREGVRSRGDAALNGDLTLLERRRLVAIAVDRGLGATRMLHKGFRLSKLFATLPLTCALLGEKRLGRQATLYWKANISASLYFFDEALGFCDHLQEHLKKGMKVKYLDEILAYERACLELQRPRANGDTPTPQLIEFRHDPEVLLNCLLRGKRPRAIPAMNRTALGQRDKDGEVRWDFVSNRKKTMSRHKDRKRSRISGKPKGTTS